MVKVDLYFTQINSRPAKWPIFWSGNMYSGFYICEQVREWMMENNLPISYVYHIPNENDRIKGWLSTGITFMFNNEEDATFFKLRWG